MTNIYAESEEFVEKVIHDLKTPIDAQIKALELFLTTATEKISTDEQDLIELTLNSCNYMQRLTDIFYCVHNLKTKKLSLNYEKFDLGELIENIINNSKILLKYYELSIDFKKEKNLIVNADKIQIKRVIENLISNSINQAFKNTEIKINLKIKNNNAIFEITNKSSYIEPKYLKEIFKKNKTQKTLYSSVSNELALFYSHEIINSHNGTISAKSYQDNENIFTFEIPIN